MLPKLFSLPKLILLPELILSSLFPEPGLLSRTPLLARLFLLARLPELPLLPELLLPSELPLLPELSLLPEQFPVCPYLVAKRVHISHKQIFFPGKRNEVAVIALAHAKWNMQIKPEIFIHSMPILHRSHPSVKDCKPPPAARKDGI